jgi:hypothetical protein
VRPSPVGSRSRQLERATAIRSRSLGLTDRVLGSASGRLLGKRSALARTALALRRGRRVLARAQLLGNLGRTRGPRARTCGGRGTPIGGLEAGRAAFEWGDAGRGHARAPDGAANRARAIAGSGAAAVVIEWISSAGGSPTAVAASRWVRAARRALVLCPRSARLGPHDRGWRHRKEWQEVLTRGLFAARSDTRRFRRGR